MSSKMLIKPILISKAELQNIGSDIKLVGINPLLDMIGNSNKSFTCKLLNWIEPYEIKGSIKTLFYTSINTELKEGDKIFIINGNYDNDLLIKNNKYKKGRDGYKILFIDKCKIVLDIDYTGIIPYLTANDDDFIKIYYIKNESEFLHANRYITTRTGNFEYKFEYYHNNIAFIDNNYSSTNRWGLNSGVSGTPGFFVRNGIYNWSNITTDVISGSYSYALSPTYNNVNRIKIMNGDFVYNGKEFKEGYIYKWEVGATQSDWEVDITYFEPYLTKNNFRDGIFKGTWNSGLYGQYSSRIKWHGNGSTWNTGSLINTIWNKGKLNSLYTSSQSYFANFDINGLPYQKINSPNNAGKGYNLISDSMMIESEVANGSFNNTVFGDQSATYSIVENEILNIRSPYLNKIQNSFFNNCKFNNSHLEDSEFNNSISNNSIFEKSKSINSQFANCVFKNSSYNSDNIIKIYAYDELTASETRASGTTHSITNGIDQKIYKFYIDKDGYNRLKINDIFYIKGIKINNGSKDVINFFDKKFKIGVWAEYTEENFTITTQGKRGYEYSAFLSTPGDNSYIFYSYNDLGSWYTTTSTHSSNNSFYSIDIWVNKYDINGSLTGDSIDFNYSSIGSGSQLNNIIDVSSAYIIDSEFDSGLIKESDWNSGHHICQNNDNNITSQTLEGGTYNLSINSNCYIVATTSYNSIYKELGLINTGDIVFLNSVDFDYGLTTSRLQDSYKVISNTNGIYNLQEIGTYSQIISLSASNGYFYTSNAENRYGHIKKLKIDKTNIKSGLLRRAYIANSLIQNEDYNYLDKDLNNLEKIRNLIISDSIFSNNGNILSNATYINSFFTEGNDNWNSGIIQNSIWNNNTFNNGVIRDTRWINGTFSNGIFYNSGTFNNLASFVNPYYYSENINSYYRKGLLPNNRNSWQNGNFINGEFNRSDWEFGTFSNGKFYYSKWYNGIFTNGILGSNTLSNTDTIIYNGTISYGIVENAALYAHDTSYTSDINQNIYWLDGIFTNGLFGSNMIQAATNSAIWHNGIFNGGQFIENGKWKNGIFNNGKFLSSYGWTQGDSGSQSLYSWENGTFNDGEFGNANGLTNSTWYTGDFNGGIFKGRTWNNGVFTYGEFQGSGGNPVSGLTCSNAQLFVNSYTYSYWGKWNNGIFTNTKDRFIKDQKFYTSPVKSSKLEKKSISNKIAKFKNGLWVSGTFSHPGGEMISSVWLDGAFEKGRFNSSSFNPYVKRNSATESFNLNDNTCYWENGDLEQSDFYISHWKNGNFLIGTATGMIWENGIVNYMNAFNIFWENGTWRNGNWYGSSFEYNGEITDDYVLNILNRGMSWSGTTSCHIWNIFQDYMGQELEITSVIASTAGTNGWQSSKYDPIIQDSIIIYYNI